MGVTCQILINRPVRGVHKAGKPVSGIVRYTVDEPGRYKDVTITLIGKGKCKWSEQQKNRRKDRFETITYIGKEVYVAQKISIHEKGPEGVFILPTGTYGSPFQFVLPNNIPSTFEDGACTIKYRLILRFERPSFLSIDQKFATEINVIGNVIPNRPEGRQGMEIEKSLFKPFSKRKHRIHLEADIPNSVFRPGEVVEINYKVTNDSDVIVPSLIAELICCKTYISDCGRRKVKTKTLSECTVKSTSVPDNAIANLTSNMCLAGFLYTIQYTRILHTDFKIKLTLQLPMPYINSSMKLPIVIGEKYGDDHVELYVREDYEEPPSYFEAMNELDEKNDEELY